MQNGSLTYNTCTYLAELFSLKMPKQEELIRKYTKKLFSPLKLFENNKKIAFYGTGERFNKFWNALQPCKEEITATICFIDSYKQSGSFFIGYEVYNVTDIKDYDIDVVVITSSKYENEMREKLERYKNEKMEVMCLSEFY